MKRRIGMKSRKRSTRKSKRRSRIYECGAREYEKNARTA
jgi:hypothetical protein